MATKIPEYKLEAVPMSDEAREAQGFKWADDEVGTRHRLGGEPDFIQQANWPSCPACRERMAFYGQLDSIGDKVMIADCGMIYVFICFDCNETTSFVQSS